MQLLSTKLYIPPSRPDLVPRPRLIDQLYAGLSGKLTLISAPAGFGKTTLLSKWIADRDKPVGDLLDLTVLLEAGKIKPVIDRSYTLSEVHEVLRYYGKGHARGKVIITVS